MQYTERAEDVAMLRAAVEQAGKSAPSASAYCVGALIVDADGNILAKGYSREMAGNTHAEEVCLLKLGIIPFASVDSRRSRDYDLAGCTLYSSMEPCSTRLSGKPPCTQLIVDAGIGRVVVGLMEPPDFVECKGVATLMKANIEVVHVRGLENECWQPNRHIRQQR